MSCNLTPILVAEYLAGDLSARQRKAYDNHLSGCEYCRTELASLSVLYEELADWSDHHVPEWSRTSVATSAQVADLSFSRISVTAKKTDRSARPKARPRSAGWRSGARQWLPLAASLLLAIAALAQIRISVDQAGWTLGLGASINPSSMVDDHAILMHQRSVDTVSAALRQRLNAHEHVSNVRGRYLAGQGILLEVSEPAPLAATPPLTRPDLDAVEVYALSLTGEEAPEPVANGYVSEQQAEIELQTFSVLCDFAGDLRLSPQEYVTLVLPAIVHAESQSVARDRMYRLSGRDLQTCLQGQKDVAALQQKAATYSY